MSRCTAAMRKCIGDARAGGYRHRCSAGAMSSSVNIPATQQPEAARAATQLAGDSTPGKEQARTTPSRRPRAQRRQMQTTLSQHRWRAEQRAPANRRGNKGHVPGNMLGATNSAPYIDILNAPARHPRRPWRAAWAADLREHKSTDGEATQHAKARHDVERRDTEPPHEHRLAAHPSPRVNKYLTNLGGSP